ncbi:MAG TPA: metal ABC transporter permease [Actinomycetes bacterium]
MSWLADTFADDFARRALVEAVLAGGLCGVVGVHVLLRRLPFLTVALAHATFPGAVLAALLGLNLLLGAGLFGVLVVLVVVGLGTRDRVEETSAVGVVLAGAFALGVLLLSAQAGFTKDLTAFLVGSILTVQRGDLVATAVAGALVLGVLAALHKELVLGAFDRGGLAALGYPVAGLDLALVLCVQLTLVSALPAVGAMLAVALVVAPAATARLWTDRLGTTMVLAPCLGIAAAVAGLAVSQHVRAAAGATIVLVAAALFGLSLLLAPRHGLVSRLRRGRPPAGREAVSGDAPARGAAPAAR